MKTKILGSLAAGHGLKALALASKDAQMTRLFSGLREGWNGGPKVVGERLDSARASLLPPRRRRALYARERPQPAMDAAGQQPLALALVSEKFTAAGGVAPSPKILSHKFNSLLRMARLLPHCCIGPVDNK